jgi:hypothetical protein
VEREPIFATDPVSAHRLIQVIPFSGDPPDGVQLTTRVSILAGVPSSAPKVVVIASFAEYVSPRDTSVMIDRNLPA